MPVDLQTARNVVIHSTLFAAVPPAAAQRALASLELLEFAPGEDVLVEATTRQGDDHSGLYIVIAGQLLASRSMPGGRTQRLSTMAPGDFFGELARVDEELRSATVTAVTPAVLGCLSGPVADRLIADAPVVMRTIAAMIARRLRAADDARVAARLDEERLTLLGKAAAMLAHDLRNPLGVVRNATQLIAAGVGDPVVWARKSEYAAEFMLGMVNDLLDFAKGNRIYAEAPVRLRDVLDDVETFGLAPLEAAGKITVRRSISDDGTFVGDRRAVSRALLNIVQHGTLPHRTRRRLPRTPSVARRD